MLKVMAVLRTAVVALLIPYSLWSLPWGALMSRTFDETYARCANSLRELSMAMAVAVVWLLVETLVGWRLAFPRKPAAAPAAPAAPRPADPPPAAPSR